MPHDVMAVCCSPTRRIGNSPPSLTSMAQPRTRPPCLPYPQQCHQRPRRQARLRLLGRSQRRYGKTPAVRIFCFPWRRTDAYLNSGEQYFSPDPAMTFSGVVACSTDVRLPPIFLLALRLTPLTLASRSQLGGPLGRHYCTWWSVVHWPLPGPRRHPSLCPPYRQRQGVNPPSHPLWSPLSPHYPAHHCPALCILDPHVYPHPTSI